MKSKTLPIGNAKLVAAACLLISTKFGESEIPYLKDLVTLCDKCYNDDHLLKMELNILIDLDFNIKFTSSYEILDELVTLSGDSDQTKKLAQYFIQLFLYDMNSS